MKGAQSLGKHSPPNLMLVSLRVENFALIDQLSLTFGDGLNVLTGETGAGKSILLEAVDTLLGAKVSGRQIRTGTQRAIIEGQFRLTPALRAWLEEQQIDPVDEEVLICSREITATSPSLRSRSRINGTLVNRQQVDSLRDRLVEITAQGQTVQLAKASVQRDWLDAYGGEPLIQQRQHVQQQYEVYWSAKQALETHQQSDQQRLQQMDMLQFQIEEFQRVGLADPEELDRLEQEYQRLLHSTDLKQSSISVLETLYENDQGHSACTDLLGTAYETLQEMVAFDEQLQPVADLVNEALTQVQEAGRQMSHYANTLETDPLRLQEVEARLAQLKQLCRKYGPTLADAIAHQQTVEAELERLTAAEESLESLSAAFGKAQVTLTQACATLTQLRQAAAQQLQQTLTLELKPLAMEKVQFQVDCQPVAPTTAGSDRITFLLSPNPGEPLQPLVETASGGEMSRFLLALKACFSQIDPVGTLIFDEIDTGVSGRVTQAIAEKLHQLGANHQVLCVTHQPIVAAIADHHFRVEKQVIPTSRSRTEARTVVRVSRLEDTQRREELAQLAGGQIDEEAIAFAQSLMNQAVMLRQQGSPLPSVASKRRSRSARSA